MLIATVPIKELFASKIDVKMKLIKLSTIILLMLISFRGGVKRFN